MTDNNLKIKSPVFTGKPGWGGKIKNWLSQNNSRILPPLAVLILIVGLYGVLNNESAQAPELSPNDQETELEVIEKIAQPREGLTHLARAALNDFLESKEISLSQAQKLFAETYLVTKLNNRLVNPGDTVTFKINDLTETIEKAQSLTPHQLQEWSKYIK